MIKNLISFFKNPEIITATKPLHVKNFILLLLLTFAVILPYGYFLQWLDIGQFDHLMEKMLKENKLLVAVLAILIAPLLEETIFRYHLDLRKPSIIWGLCLAVFVTSEFWYLVVAFVIYMVYLLASVSRGNPPSLKLVVYASAFFFAVVHMGNFKGFDFIGNFYWIPLMVAGQFFLALILSYIRLHYGLAKAMLFHGVYNAILVVPMLFLEIL